MCALAVVAASSVEAQDASVDEHARTEAREIAARATDRYNVGDFDAALAGYTDAYEVFPAPQLLFNMGQCHREMGQYGRVIFFFERYLEELPEAENAEVVLEHLAEARTAQAEENARMQRVEAARLDLTVAGDTGRTPEPSGAVYEQWWFWTVIGAAVVAIGVGVGLAVALSAEPQLPMGSLGTVDAR